MIEIFNEFGVSANGTGGVTILLPPRKALGRDQALQFAAWIVAIAALGDRKDFDAIYKMVLES